MINAIRRVPRILEEQHIYSDIEEIFGRENISAEDILHHLKQVDFNYVPSAVIAPKH